MMLRRFSQYGLVVILSVVAFLSTSLVHAEQKKTFDKFDVHYVAASTAMLTPAIAKIYNIQPVSYTHLTLPTICSV